MNDKLWIELCCVMLLLLVSIFSANIKEEAWSKHLSVLIDLFDDLVNF